MVRTELSDSELFKVVSHSDLKKKIPSSSKLVLVLQDEWQSSCCLAAYELLQPLGIPWLYGYVARDEGIVGPWVRPGAAGCPQCANTRRFLAGRESDERLENLLSGLLSSDGVTPDPRPSRTALGQVAQLIVAEAYRELRGSRTRAEERMYLIDLKTLQSSLHFFLPDPFCSICGRLPDDSAAEAQIELKPSPKISKGHYRCRSLDEFQKVLVMDYLDVRTGLFNARMHELASPFANVTVNLPSFSTGDEVTGGRSNSFIESELTAIMEGLERNCGLTPRGKRTVIKDSFRNLQDQALHPIQVGVYTEEQYAEPDFPFEPFDPDRPLDWVWGYSFLQERPILVPERLAYYSTDYGGGFVQETSNGSAIGGSMEEAILYGILEVVERDSFLITWYAQLPVPRLDPRSADDQELLLMIDWLHNVAGYDVYLFNMTMENRVPSIWALAKNRGSRGPNLLCAAGAHLDPIRAAKSAIHELSGMMRPLQEKFEAHRDEYVSMLHDSSLVQQMEDHSLLYCLPEAEERLQFLLDEQRPLRTFNEEFHARVQHPDLTDELKDLLQVFLNLNLDVIVVNQSSPETMRNGLYCVKVLIPGMLPMSFGHHLTRLNGLDRVLKIPAQLGYVKQPLSLEQLNPHPHPFP
ncbi:TOMM precursor leader peptide-binding protein [Paenibacillus sp. J2TS4]|uniref:TOMM precursor leader peptide-binding protein n=1 Tax=Paenibacillus sp. J2TS4 TaxID=2807194 RepID=UPI0020C12D1C|nr:TOMM precursor leader peptide-binding protein [Paenibacillus sp. J2TS4]